MSFKKYLLSFLFTTLMGCSMKYKLSNFVDPPRFNNPRKACEIKIPSNNYDISFIFTSKFLQEDVDKASEIENNFNSLDNLLLSIFFERDYKINNENKFWKNIVKSVEEIGYDEGYLKTAKVDEIIALIGEILAYKLNYDENLLRKDERLWRLAIRNESVKMQLKYARYNKFSFSLNPLLDDVLSVDYSNPDILFSRKKLLCRHYSLVYRAIFDMVKKYNPNLKNVLCGEFGSDWLSHQWNALIIKERNNYKISFVDPTFGDTNKKKPFFNKDKFFAMDGVHFNYFVIAEIYKKLNKQILKRQFCGNVPEGIIDMNKVTKIVTSCYERILKESKDKGKRFSAFLYLMNKSNDKKYIGEFLKEFGNKLSMEGRAFFLYKYYSSKKNLSEDEVSEIKSFINSRKLNKDLKEAYCLLLGKYFYSKRKLEESIEYFEKIKDAVYVDKCFFKEKESDGAFKIYKMFFGNNKISLSLFIQCLDLNQLMKIYEETGEYGKAIELGERIKMQEERFYEILKLIDGEDEKKEMNRVKQYLDKGLYEKLEMLKEIYRKKYKKKYIPLNKQKEEEKPKGKNGIEKNQYLLPNFGNLN